MNTNFEINETTKRNFAVVYGIQSRRLGAHRIINENTFKDFSKPQPPPASILTIYDESGREVLSIERNDS